MKSILISGFGDIGQRVAKACLQKGIKVFGLRRTLAPMADALHSVGIVEFDLDQQAHEQPLPKVDIVFHFAPPPLSGQTDPRLHQLLSNFGPQTKPGCLVLISTTAVYGDCAGEWVTEQTATDPQTDRGKRRLHAEQTATQWCSTNQVRLVILRVPGIYGPGRLPLERLIQGLPVLVESKAPFTNRIHSEDLALVCMTVAENTSIKGVYNVSDGEPGNMTQYFKAVADASGLPRPEEVDMDEAKRRLSAGMLSYLSESRRIDNKKLLRDTGVRLQYPTLALGLKASVGKA